MTEFKIGDRVRITVDSDFAEGSAERFYSVGDTGEIVSITTNIWVLFDTFRLGWRDWAVYREHMEVIND